MAVLNRSYNSNIFVTIKKYIYNVETLEDGRINHLIIFITVLCY